MLELTDWFASVTFPARPWLIVGKGPTFDKLSEFDLSGFNLMGLNHVVRRLEVDVAHIIDIDAARDCSERLASACRWLVMPRHPHAANLPGRRRIESYFDELPVLRDLDRDGRLVWYNLAGDEPRGRSPVIRSRYFSSEAALDILGRMGVRTVHSLGVDGGRSYASEFEDLADATLLTNGLPTFDLQFEQLRIIAEDHDIAFSPLVECRSILSDASLELAVAQHRIAELERRIDRIHESLSWRIGDPVARALRLPSRLLRAIRR